MYVFCFICPTILVRTSRCTEILRVYILVSPAGAGHETDKSRFGTVRVRVEGRRNRIKLRLKRPEIQRVRKRGGDIEVLKKK